MLVMSRYLFLMTEELTDGIIEFMPCPLLPRPIGQTANCAPSRKSDGRLSVGGAVAVKQHLL